MAVQCKQRTREFLMHGLILMTITLWASAFVGIRYSADYYTPMTLALDRLLIALALIFPAYLLRRRRLNETQREKPTFLAHLGLLVFGLMGLSVYFLALNASEQTITSGLACFLIAQSPLLVIVLASFIFKEKISKIGRVGLLISCVGVLMMGSDSLASADFSLGFWEASIAVLCSATWSLSQRYLSRYFHPLYIILMSLFYGCVLLLCLNYHDWWASLHSTSIQHLWPVIYLGVFSTAIAYFLWSYALSHLKASSAVGWMYIMPLLTLLMAYLFLHEVTSLWICVGGLIGLLGSICIVVGQNRSKCRE